MTTTATHAIPPTPGGQWLLSVHEFLAVADALTEAGFDVGPEVQKLEDIQRAVDAAVSADHGLSQAGDLLSMDPDEVAQRVRDAALNRANVVALADSAGRFTASLARPAAAALAQRSDPMVTAMRKDFDRHLKVVTAAHKAGLTPDMTGDQLADTGTAEQITAYRDLPDAVAALNRLAGLRDQLTTVVGVGPAEHPVAAYVTGVPDLPSLEGAGMVYRGEERWEQAVTHMNGYHMRQVPVRRLGGPWLALLVAGYTVRLNTGPEAHAVVTTARTGA